jgi:N-methylhydantoinase B
VTIDPGGPNERVLSGLCDDEPIAAGEIVRIETTGGGGWGDPLDRDPELVAVDVLQGKVSAEAAAADYGVVVGDPEATRRSRQELRDRRGEPAFFDRGPGYATLS